MTDPDLILIHGTFAPNADWTKTDSGLAGAITRATKFRRAYPFKWGLFNNSDDARTKAAERLAKTIKNECDVNCVIVAHSHGGNVAIEALQNATVASKVICVVCMATPFVRYATRPPIFMLIYRLILLILAIAAFLIIGWQTGSMIGNINDYVMAQSWIPDFVKEYYTTRQSIDSAILKYGAFAFSVLMSIVALLASISIARSSSDELLKGVNIDGHSLSDIVRQSEVPRIEITTPLLCVRIAYDEAWGLLTLLKRIANLPIRFAPQILSISIIGAVSAGWMYELNTFQDTLNVGEDVRQSFEQFLRMFAWTAIGIGVPAIIYAMIALIDRVAGTILLGIAIGFGKDGALKYFAYDVELTQQPQGCKDVSTYDIRVSDVLREFGLLRTLLSLRHGLVYRDYGTIERVSAFIKQAVANSRCGETKVYQSIGQ